MSRYFADIEPITFGGPDSTDPMVFRHYDPSETLGNKSMAEHLRFAVCYWPNFVREGNDPFGGQTFDRPWFPSDTMALAKQKADDAFDMFRILGVPYFCFCDHDVRPEGDSLQENHKRLNKMADYMGDKMANGGPKLLWGTTNMFSNRRYMSGASTNPDPDVLAYCASTVKTCMDVTQRLMGENYVLWGGREGYETLLNTDLHREMEQMGRFLSMVVEYKHKIGYKGAILIEPKPQEPTKHQYDYDVATVFGFLKRFGLENEVQVNVEQGHAILAGHSFEHELAMARTLGIFGSIDMHRNDCQSGWDTDQFPNSPSEAALAYYEVLKAGGFKTGGTNFDAKLQRQSLDASDLIAAHVGGMDVCARGLKSAHAMITDNALEAPRRARYAGWETDTAEAMLAEGSTLDAIAADAEARAISPQPVSGQQEKLENIVNRYV